VAPLHRRRRRRVIGRDEIERAVEEALPQRVAVGSAADWRRTLELGGAVGDLVAGEREVVRARLRRYRNALRLAAAITATPSADETWTMCTRAPNSSASRTIRRIASASAAHGLVAA